MYAKYRKSNGCSQGAWFISFNPDQGGYRGKDKGAIWRQIRCNASYRRDMNVYGKVHFYVRDITGRVVSSIILYADGRKDAVTVMM